MKFPWPLLLSPLLIVGCDREPPLPAMGTLERDRIEITAEHSERLLEIPVTEGQRVSTGDLLARQDPERLEARLQAARAERDARAAILAELVRGPRRERVQEARAALARLEAERERAEREFARIQRLHGDGLASSRELDTARAARDSARGALDEQRARLDSLLEGTTVEELDRARADLAAAEAMVEQQALELRRLEIRSPIDGRIEALPFETGERVAAGQAVAVMVTGRPYARVYLPQELRNRIASGSSGEIRLDGHPDPYPGRVRFVATEASFTPFFALTERDRGRLVYRTEVELTADPPPDLPIGAPVTVNFPDPE